MSMCVKLCVTFSLVLAIVHATACSKTSPLQNKSSTTVPLNRAEQRVVEVLKRLLQCTTDGSDCFVIIEDPSSGKFVQFTGSVDHPLLLDMPTEQRTSEEIRQIKRVAEAYGRLTETEFSLQCSFGSDAQSGARAAISVLRDAYGLDESVKLAVSANY